MNGYRPLHAWPPNAGLWLPGVAANNVTTPDEAALDITGGIDIRALVKPDTWTPAATQGVLSKESGSATRSYRIYINTNGSWGATLSGNGSEQVQLNRTPDGLVDGVRKWMRFTWDSGTAHGAWYSSDDGEAWTQAGETLALALTGGAIYSSTSPIEIGTRHGGTLDVYKGVIYEAQVRNGIAGTVVANPIFQHPATGWTMAGTTMYDGSRAWTINGTRWEWRR